MIVCGLLRSTNEIKEYCKMAWLEFLDFYFFNFFFFPFGSLYSSSSHLIDQPSLNEITVDFVLMMNLNERSYTQEREKDIQPQV